MTNLNSAIEWTDCTWSPTVGCAKVTPGCDNCYAERLTERFHGKGSFAEVRLHHDRLEAPLRWRKPRRVFVNSMSDLFHDAVSDEFIARVWATMAATPQHTYQILTKRHGRMRSLLNSEQFKVWSWAARAERDGTCVVPDNSWPLPNVWLGVSVEDQKRADLRIPALLGTPAAVRFLSCEPLLGAVDLTGYGTAQKYWLTGRPGWGSPETTASGLTMQPLQIGPRIDWVIAGGESGPNARPMHPDWARSLRDQCQAAGIPFFFKQWGEWGPMAPVDAQGRFQFDGAHPLANDGTLYQPNDLTYPDGPRYGEAIRASHDRARLTNMYRVGKKRAGRELDGRTWDEFPMTVVAA